MKISTNYRMSGLPRPVPTSLAAALLAASGVLVLLLIPPLLSPDLFVGQSTTVATTSAIVFIVFNTAICVSLVVLAVFAWRGRFWVTIVATLCALPAVVTLIVALPETALAAVAATIGLTVAAVSLWLPAARRYSRAQAIRRGSP